MIAATCRRCGSTKLQKNGRTATGQQKFYCTNCHGYGTLDRKDAERAQQEAMVLRLYQERVSQRAIARITTLSRMTVAKILKKKVSGPSETPFDH